MPVQPRPFPQLWPQLEVVAEPWPGVEVTDPPVAAAVPAKPAEPRPGVEVTDPPVVDAEPSSVEPQMAVEFVAQFVARVAAHSRAIAGRGSCRPRIAMAKRTSVSV
jgi:hypothetical protein